MKWPRSTEAASCTSTVAATPGAAGRHHTPYTRTARVTRANLAVAVQLPEPINQETIERLKDEVAIPDLKNHGRPPLGVDSSNSGTESRSGIDYITHQVIAALVN